jgi:SAM-dependent methyltransferase
MTTRYMNPAEFANIAKAEKDLWWFRGMRAVLFQLLNPHLEARSIRRVLEAGCGTGYLARLLEAAHPWSVVPFDVSGEGLRFALELGSRQAVQGSITAMPFAATTFDMVISMDVLVHLPHGEEQAAAQELARVLVPGGLAVVRAAAFDFLRSRHSEFVHERQRFTRSKLVSIMSAAGIRKLRCTYANSLLLPVALAKFRIWEPLLRKPPKSGLEGISPWLNRLLYTPLSMEAAWLGTGLNLPAGQSLIFIGEKAA